MDPVKKLTKIFFDIDPVSFKSSNVNEYEAEAKIIVKEMQYVRTAEKLASLLQAIFTKSVTSALTNGVNWKSLADIILKDEDLKKLVGRLS